MHCVECNINNGQREQAKKLLNERFIVCPCCNGTGHISFHRYVQWRLGWVCWLDHSGNEDASLEEMNRRCDSIIRDCYKSLNKKINRKWNKCEDHYASPSSITQFYCSQFLGKDCKTKNNY